MEPDWLGQPQHVVAGVLVALVAGALAHRLRLGPPWLIALLAAMAAVTAETVFELLEYWLLDPYSYYADPYPDTIADLASTMVGGIVGAALVWVWLARRRA